MDNILKLPIKKIKPNIELQFQAPFSENRFKVVTNISSPINTSDFKN